MQENIQEKDINHQVLVILLQKIIELLATKDEPIESLDINNLDEIKAHLRNELSPLIKSIKESSDRSEVLKALKKLSEDINKIEFNPKINVSSPEVNIPEIKIPNINIPEVNVPTPQVTVNVPDVIVPEFNIPTPIVNVQSPIVNVPEVNLDEVIDELNIGLKKLRQNNMSNPVFVRMTDINKILEKLDGVTKASKEVMLGFPGSIRIQNATGGTVDFNTTGGNIFQLVPKVYDYISLTPPSLPTSIIFKTGGSGGATVATLTIVYSGSDISTITRT